MKLQHTKLLVAGLAVTVVLAIAVAASADTIVVKPDTLVDTGWVLATQAATPGGSPHPKFVMGPGTAPEGIGSFRFDTEQITGVDPLQKIYLGTNNYSGVALKDITSFKYYTYLNRRAFGGGGGWPDGQPPMIEIITDKGSESTDQRRFVFKPWGWWGGHDVAGGTWQEWDLMADYASPRWQMIGPNVGTNVFGNWSWVKSRYLGDMRFSTPNVGEYTADPVAGKHYNQSGTSISIKVGSGKANDNMFNQDALTWEYKAWWRESCWIDAYADKLVIGVNGVETVYDFEGGTGMTVAIGTGAARDNIIAAAKDNFYFVVFGKVMDNPAPTGSEFYLEDGSGKKIRVIAQNGAMPGEYWRAQGTLEWNDSVNRYDLRSSTFDIYPLN